MINTEQTGTFYSVESAIFLFLTRLFMYLVFIQIIYILTVSLSNFAFTLKYFFGNHHNCYLSVCLLLTIPSLTPFHDAHARCLVLGFCPGGKYQL